MRRSKTVGRAVLAATTSALAAMAAGCPEVNRPTELEPDGPPEVLQVFVRERVALDDGTIGPGPQLAFGAHPDAADHDGVVDAAIAGGEQRIRVVVDELLLGNALEEVQCVNPDTWSQVPVGTTPDDVRLCTGVDISRCRAVCKDQGGVLDANMDGGLDNTRLIAGTVRLSCGGIDVAVDPEGSFYNPSGNQLLPAGALGFDGLGPAIVVVAADSLPTSADCSIAFGDTVVDKQGVRPCASAGACSPGDMSGLRFRTEPFQVLSSDPPNEAADVDLVETDGTDGKVVIHFNVKLDAATLSGAVLSTGGAPVAGATVALEHSAEGEELPDTVRITVPGGFQPATTYTVTFPAEGAIKDRYGAVLASPPTITFTTKAAAAAAR